MRAKQFIKSMKEAVAPAPVVPNAATQARIAAAPQGYDPNTGKPVAAPGVTSGVTPVKKGGTLPMTKKVMTPDQIKQYNAKQSASKQATATQPAAAPAAQQQPAAPTTAQPAQQQPAAAPAAQQQPATPKAPWDPATGQGVKYDGVTGEPTPEWQKELDRQEAARLEKVEANRIASQAAAAERDAQNAELVRQGLRQNPSNVTNNVTQTTAAPGNVKIANGDPAQVKAAMQAKIAAMQAKNPKLAAAMQAEIDALEEGLGSKLAGLGLAGAMALGSAGAQARVTPDGQGGYTGGFKPAATATATDNKPAATPASQSFSKEYLQRAADPNRTGRYMISVEKAQELLSNMQEGADNEKIGGRHDADDFDDMVSRLKKLAGAGPMKTVYDPDRRVYRNVPTAVQPAQQPKKAPQ
jgi:hypothetical protein